MTEPTEPPSTSDRLLTIEELAEHVGMTIRNIRAHQSRGLLPPPERRGRVSYYGPPHQQALVRIRELQERGYNLAAIAEMLTESASADAAMRRLLLAPLLADDEVVLTRSEMATLFAVRPSRRRLRLAIETGLIRDLGDGHYLVPSQRLLDATKSLVELGIPVVDIYELQLDVARSTNRVARRFVEMCLRAASEPAAADPLPPDRWDEVNDRFQRLRTLTTMVLAATFSINVRRASEQILDEQDGDGMRAET